MKPLLPYRWMFSNLFLALILSAIISCGAGIAIAQSAVKKADKATDSLREQTI